ncbi:MAG: Smr/MutS family protein [Candidatus Paceibacterota bacterium]
MSYYKGMGNKYEQVPETVIDFHGYTTLECSDALDELLRDGACRHVRLIVGRGRNSAHGPVLPDFVKQYLRARGIRFNPSKIADGGEGSLEVFLR